MERVGAALLPFETIVSASRGDAEAIDQVLAFYGDYIKALSTRTLYDKNNAPYFCVDHELQRRLETKLTARLLRFDASKIF